MSDQEDQDRLAESHDVMFYRDVANAQRERAEKAEAEVTRLTQENKTAREDSEVLQRDALTIIAAFRQENEQLKADHQRLTDAAEMLWVVLANVSGGDWEKQSPEWQEAAARWRDSYFMAVKPDLFDGTSVAAPSA